jgi:hypothetical protein
LQIPAQSRTALPLHVPAQSNTLVPWQVPLQSICALDTRPVVPPEHMSHSSITAEPLHTPAQSMAGLGA